jgi:RNA polymerase sigma factor (TIGR02999 family)
VPHDPSASDPLPGDVTSLLLDWSRGHADALEKLMPVVYEELRRLAKAHLGRERREHTLQPTDLVHEAYLKLVDQRHVDWKNRAHFFAVAARVMRRVLVDHARARLAQKRGGGAVRVTFDETLPIDTPNADVTLLALDDALTELGTLDARQARTVELRYFAGLTVDEAAEALGVSGMTVKRDWTVAKAWLKLRLEGAAPAP